MFKLEIETVNAAFGETNDARRAELARILRTIADRVENGVRVDGLAVDSNGNRVGRWFLTGR